MLYLPCLGPKCVTNSELVTREALTWQKREIQLDICSTVGYLTHSVKRHESTEKGISSCILPPCLFNLYAEYIMQNAGVDEVQAGIKIARRNIKTSDMQMTPPLWQKVKN